MNLIYISTNNVHYALYLQDSTLVRISATVNIIMTPSSEHLGCSLPHKAEAQPKVGVDSRNKLQ